MKLKDKVWVITGAGSGMGRQLATQVIQAGGKVFGIDLNETSLNETSALINSLNFKSAVVNITDREVVTALPAKVIEVFGSVDGLVNNAGIIQKFVHIKDLEMAEIERVMNVNFYGMVNMTKAFLPTLLERTEAHVVNISSMGGFIPVPGQSIYGAAKAAVKLFTEGLYAELQGTSTHVTVIFPGAIATNISVNSGLEMPKAAAAQKSKFKPLPAEKAAELILKAVENNEFRATIGPDARSMDWLYRLSPKFAVGLIQRKMAELLK